MQKRVLLILGLIGALYFEMFAFANNTGARDAMMISLFEPDEFAQYPVVMRMLTSQPAWKQAVFDFIAYRHYYYGSSFYFGSALLLLPVKLAAGLEHTQLNMLLLRQFVSVLPMLAALLLLTWLQTRFRSYFWSIGLFVLLLSIPAVVENSLWWHVDSLAVLFVVLTLYFLDRDALRLRRDFYLAAASTGLAVGTKIIGVFFVVAVPLYLLIAIAQRRATWQRAILSGVAFVAVMAAAIVIANPFLLLRSEFDRMFSLLTRQAEAMSAGWTLHYASGPASWLGVLRAYYGGLTFIGLALVSLAVGTWRSESRLRSILIAAWAIPFGLYVLLTIAIKPTHFFLPILLPVFSSLAVWEGAARSGPAQGEGLARWLPRLGIGLAAVIVVYQFMLNVRADASLYREALTREHTNGALVFYSELEGKFLPRLPADVRLKVFRDVRMYFPEGPRWTVRTFWNASYRTIENIKPDLIVLWYQRVLDYTQEGAREQAIDPETFQSVYDFYVDADNDQLRGYRLLYRDATGLFFASQAAYEAYFR